jgi:hypothetical protein
MLKKSVRIQLFDKEGMVSDRLVTQLTEFYAGPKEVHGGPLRIEFTFEEQKDVESALLYLKQLTGLLPIQSHNKVRTSTKDTNPNDNYEGVDKEKVLFDTIEKSEDQDKLIKSLREMGFIFVISEQLQFVLPSGYKVNKEHIQEYDWLIRKVKEAKDPKNDKYDPQIMVGIKVREERSRRIVIYTYGKFHSNVKLKVPVKRPISLSKTNLIKFPHYMIEEERLKWNFEHRALFQNKNKKPSKFYERWRPDVIVGDELKISEEDLKSRFSDED